MHGLREIQQDTLYFISDQTYYVFFWRFLDRQRMGILQSIGVLVFVFFCDFPSALDSGAVVDILGKHF